jgi:hypothetical protein
MESWRWLRSRGKRKEVGDILPLTRQSKQDPKYSQCHRSDPRYPEPHALIELPAGQADNEIVSSRGGTRDEQSGDNGQDRRERNRRDEARQDASTNGPRQVDGSQIISAKQRAAGVGIGGIATEEAILPYPMTNSIAKNRPMRHVA